VAGVRVLDVYNNGGKLKNLAYLDTIVTLEYDAGVPEGAQEALNQLFDREEVIVEKRSKNGYREENIIPMIRSLQVVKADNDCLELHARVCCQNPTLNPIQLAAAIEKYLPGLKPDFVKCSRQELLDTREKIFR